MRSQINTTRYAFPAWSANLKRSKPVDIYIRIIADGSGIHKAANEFHGSVAASVGRLP